MRSEGGHAVRHLRDEGLIANSDSLSSQVAELERLTTPILLAKATFAPIIAVGKIVSGVINASTPMGQMELAISVAEVYARDGLWDTVNVHFNPMYGAVAAGFGAYDNCVAGKYGDALIDAYTGVGITALTAAGARGLQGVRGAAVKPASTVLPGLPASAPKPLGTGTTGRTTPANLTEQLAMTEVRASPGGRILTNIVMSDPRWLAAGGWVKMEQKVNGVVIHYVKNYTTGAVDDFKFIGDAK